MASSPYMVASLLEKVCKFTRRVLCLLAQLTPIHTHQMSSLDADFRYMATNDLMEALKKSDLTLDDTNEKKIVAAVLKLLQDNNGEVQNLAVKA